MGIIFKVTPAAKHVCSPPYDPKPETIYGLETVWECDVCKRQAILKYDQRDGYVWQWTYTRTK